MNDDYARWIIVDQALGLLNMTEREVATIMGISRQTLAKYREANNYDKLTLSNITKIEGYLRTIKAALLTTEAPTPEDK